MDILLNTIRYYFKFSISYHHGLLFFSDEIACCMEKSYRKISFNEAARILYLNKPDELVELSKKVQQYPLFIIFI